MPEVSIDNMKLAHATQFLDRVQHELCKYVTEQVRAEAANAQFHEQRMLLGDRILSDPGNFASKLAVSMVHDASLSGTYAAGPPVDSTATDAAIFAVVNAQYNKWFNVV